MWKEPKCLPCESPSLVVAPRDIRGALPVLYLLHGQFDWEEDWFSKEKGRLGEILSKVNPPPFILAMPFCADERLPAKKDQTEPPLEKFAARLEQIVAALRKEYTVDDKRQGILGISMGGRQALWCILKDPGRFSVLGVLSGKLQKRYLSELKDKVQWPQNLGEKMQLYFHYCGKRETESIFQGNFEACEALGKKLKINLEGEHNWSYWRPELECFIESIRDIWR
jgi:S-formylglutathione hydrolase FrmB